VPKPSAVIFDLGRVLVGVDTTRGLWDRILQAMGRDNKDTPQGREWLGIYQRFATGKISPRDFHPEVCRLLGEDLSWEKFQAGWCDVFYTLPGAEQLLRDVMARLPVGLLSDTDPLHWAFELENHPWLRMIENPSLSFNIGVMKPSPEAYKAAARKVGFEPSDCFFVDDLIENVEGARSAGMDAEQFTSYEVLRRHLVDRGVL
jgi:glucose-1-phosphatase